MTISLTFSELLHSSTMIPGTFSSRKATPHTVLRKVEETAKIRSAKNNSSIGRRRYPTCRVDPDVSEHIQRFDTSRVGMTSVTFSRSIRFLRAVRRANDTQNHSAMFRSLASCSSLEKIAQIKYCKDQSMQEMQLSTSHYCSYFAPIRDLRH